MPFYLSNAELREAAEVFRVQFPSRVSQVLEKASQSCEGKFKLPFTMAAEEWVDHGSHPDWLFNPTEDLEYTWILNRHWHFRDLGIAYLLTGEERYVEAFKRHCTSWIKQNPMPTSLPYEQLVYFQRPGPWRLLEVGLRVQSWIWGYMLMSHSSLFEADFEQQWRDSLAEHASFLSRFLGETSINHATMHMQGLFMVGTFLADHTDAPFWRQLAQERLILCMHDQIRADGIQNELTPHYHTGSLDMFGTPYLLAKQTGRPFPASYRDKLKSMVALSMATIRPDGKSIALSDSDSSAHVRAKVGFIGAICEDETICRQGQVSEDLLWMLGGEKFVYWLERMGTMEKETPSTITFPDSGYYVMRNAEQYVFFDAAPMGGAHGHADALHFEWMVGDRLLFGDSGRYTYQEGDWRHYFKGTSAHNTITVDGQDQTPYVSTQQWGEPEAAVDVHRWESCEAYDFIDASHNGYTRLENPVTHRRWLLVGDKERFLLVVDWLDGQGEHQLAQNFHLPADAKVAIQQMPECETMEATVQCDDDFHIRMCWAVEHADSSELLTKQGWRSDDYGTKASIPVMSYRQSFTDRTVISTLCLPNAASLEQNVWQVDHFNVSLLDRRVNVRLVCADVDHRRIEIGVDEQGVSIKSG